jgi:hypothetical protein
VPINRRGIALALMVGNIILFSPYVMYAQLLSTRASWRWGMWISLIWNAVVFVGLATCYFPKAHPRMGGMSKVAILKQIDYIGAILSTVGICIL